MASRQVSDSGANISSIHAHHRLHCMRKFDLILHHDNGLEYDENGCLFPCIPGCKKPVYCAGQMISGYLLVRPTKKLVITGEYNNIYHESIKTTGNRD